MSTMVVSFTSTHKYVITRLSYHQWLSNSHVYTLVYFNTPGIFAETYPRFTPEHFSCQKAPSKRSKFALNRLAFEHRKTTTDISFLTCFDFSTLLQVVTFNDCTIFVIHVLIQSQRESIEKSRYSFITFVNMPRQSPLIRSALLDFIKIGVKLR